MQVRSKLALTCGLLISTLACSDWSVDLPNGYSLTSFRPGLVDIVEPGTRRVVVLPHVAEFAVVRDLVVGHAIVAEPLDASLSCKPIGTVRRIVK